MATSNTILVNRAPVLALWAAVVAERLGFDREEALTLGRAVSGLNAQSKGRRLGIFKPHEEKPASARKQNRGEQFQIELCGRGVPAINTVEGIRAVSRGETIDPDSVEEYLEAKFGERMKPVRTAMMKLAKRYKPQELAKEAYVLYEEFRPRIPGGKKGWGAKGELDIKLIESIQPKRQ